jgi:biotin operon repressor
MTEINPAIAFEGKTYQPELDFNRLTTQLEKVKALMADGHWRSLQEIARSVGGSESGVSARLRDLRKIQFGGYRVNHKRIADPMRGMWVYQVLPK